ncbi:MAG: hypothetical protein HY673_17300 [Chloroflexi bacterium]|nr:hypothetical protein [Chloroflexota bacterium]
MTGLHNTCQDHDETHALVARIGLNELKQRADDDILAEHDYLVREQAELVADGPENPRYGCFLQHRVEMLANEIERRKRLVAFGASPLAKPTISSDLVVRIKGAVDLATVIGRDVEVKPAPKGEWVYCCPVHGDEHASARIYPDGHWFCYGCSVGGDVFDWLRAVRHYEFREAVEYLAAVAGIPLESGSQPKRRVKVG